MHSKKQEDGLKKYEVTFIFDPREEVETLKNYVKELFKSQNGSVIDEKDWGLRKLAYSINKRDKGFYYIVNAQLDETKNEVLKRELNLKEPVLRYLFIKKA